MGKVLAFRHRYSGTSKSIKIKLELDTNPPLGGHTEQKYIGFPVTVPVVAHDLPSLFAGKSHALLCRPWEKGRDWYDFVWYVGRKTQLNYELLSSALKQLGPWKGQNIHATKEWYLDEISKKIHITDWKKQKKDVMRFLKQDELDLIASWSSDFFMDRVQALKEYLTGS